MVAIIARPRTATPRAPWVKAARPRADAGRVTSSRALALLAAFASPVMMVAAIAGWLDGVWPATPATFAISAFAVIGGPLLGIAHVMTDGGAVAPAAPAPASPAAPAPPAPAARRAPAPAPQPFAVLRPVVRPVTLPLTPRAASARAFYNWRTQAHPAIERRERELRASRYIRR